MVTGRVAQAKDLLLRAAKLANESGSHEVKLKMASKQIAVSTRQCCYAAQRTYIKQIVRAAEAEGKNPEAWLRGSLLDGVKGEFVNTPPATWPSASIFYRFVNGEHFLVIAFRRIATDPLWADMLTENLSVGAPEKRTVKANEIVEDFE